MEILTAILLLLSGLGVFLVGVKILSDNIEKLASRGIRKMFNKISGNKLLGVGIGAVSTAIIHSSSAVTIMVVGLVNANVVNLSQATTVIFGANIGTTITSIVAALGSFGSLNYFFMSLACIGIFFSIFGKKEKFKQIGMFIAGLGCLFVGLELMKYSMSGFTDELQNILMKFKNPFLLFLFGIVATILVQSSTVVMGILIAMAGSGIAVGGGGNSVYFIVLGTNIGTCAYTLISSIGTNTNAKRAAFIHLLFNFVGSILFFLVLLCWKNFQTGLWHNINSPEMELSMFHLAFNLLCTILFLPFTSVFVKASQWVIKDKKEEEKESKYGFLDKRLLETPPVAIEASKKEAIKMLEMSMQSLSSALEFFIAKDDSRVEDVFKDNEGINAVSRRLTKYLINISSRTISKQDEKVVTALHATNSDITRISDLSENLLKYTRREVKEDLIFSNQVKTELSVMFEKLDKMAKLIRELVIDGKKEKLSEIDKLEDTVDKLRKELINSHIERLKNGECRAESNGVFINLVSNLERVGDHLTYISHALA